MNRLVPIAVSRQERLQDSLHPSSPFSPFFFTIDEYQSSRNTDLGIARKSARGFSRTSDWVESDPSFYTIQGSRQRIQMIQNEAERYYSDFQFLSAPLNSRKWITNHRGKLHRAKQAVLDGYGDIERYLHYQRKAYSPVHLAGRKEGKSIFNRYSNTGIGVWTGAINGIFVLDCDAYDVFNRSIDLLMPLIEQHAGIIEGARRGGHFVFKTEAEDQCFRPRGQKWEIINSSDRYVMAAPSLQQPGLRRHDSSNDPHGNIIYQHYSIYRPTREEWRDLEPVDPSVIIQAMLQQPVIYSLPENPYPKARPIANEEPHGLYERSAKDICSSCLPQSHGERNQAIFKAARLLKAANPEASGQDLLEDFTKHFTFPCLNGGLTATKSIKVFSDDFQRAFKNAYAAVDFLPRAEAKLGLLEAVLDQVQPGLRPSDRKALAMCIAIELAVPHDTPYISRRDLAHAVTGDRSASSGQKIWHRLLKHFDLYQNGLEHPVLREASKFKVKSELLGQVTDLLRRIANKLHMSREDVLLGGSEVLSLFTNTEESTEKPECEQKQVTGFCSPLASAVGAAAPSTQPHAPPTPPASQANRGLFDGEDPLKIPVNHKDAARNDPVPIAKMPL